MLRISVKFTPTDNYIALKSAAGRATAWLKQQVLNKIGDTLKRYHSGTMCVGVIKAFACI